LVAGGYVRPAYGRKGHLKAIWLLKEDGGNPVQARAHNGTRYSFIETLDNGRCWQLRRLERRDTTTPDGSPVTVRDAFLQVVRDCMASTPDTMAARALPDDSSVMALAANSLADPRRRAVTPTGGTFARGDGGAPIGQQ
jgi:hypothetical protein